MAELIISIGGRLGFFCNHQYAHTHDAGRKSIPAAFKGVDLAVFTTFHSLGLKPAVRPVLKDDSHQAPVWGGLSADELFKLESVNEFNEKMNVTCAQEEDEDEEMSDEDEDEEMSDEDEDEEMSDEDEYGSEGYGDRTIVGTEMHEIMPNDVEEEAYTVSYKHKGLDFLCLLLLWTPISPLRSRGTLTEYSFPFRA